MSTGQLLTLCLCVSSVILGLIGKRWLMYLFGAICGMISIAQIAGMKILE